MTTADRIDQVGYRNWQPAAVAGEGVYVGKHRNPGRRGIALFRMFYTPRHLSPRR